MLIGLIFSMLVSANAQERTTPGDTEPFLKCVEVCKAWADEPGASLRACLSDCSKRYLKEPLPKIQKPMAPQWCETYEDDCQRGDTGI